MPPSLALLICVGFAAYLMRLDAKQSRKLSKALWIPTLWMLYCGSRPVEAWFGSSSGTIEEGSGKDRWFQLVLMISAVAVLAKRQFDWRATLRANGWLMAVLPYAALSIVWSDESFVSLKRWVRMSGSVIVAMVVTSERDWQRGMEAVLRRCVYILIPFSLLLIKYFQNLGIEYNKWTGQRMWVGVTTQKNGLG